MLHFRPQMFTHFQIYYLHLFTHLNKVKMKKLIYSIVFLLATAFCSAQNKNDSSLNVKVFFDDGYEKYKKLTERGKYIIDSLIQDGIPMFQNDYLVYEPPYMKPGRRTYKSWIIQGKDIKIYYYTIWNNSKSNGFELIKEVAVK